MTIFDAFRYDGKRALVVGAASGMGAAVAELALDAGAEVVAMDIAECLLAGAKDIRVNLADQASIEAAVDACGGPVHALVPLCGRGRRHPGNREDQLHRTSPPHQPLAGLRCHTAGSAIGFISSAAGLGWEANLDLLKEYLDTPDFDAAARWIEEHGKADYMWSKQAICAYVAHQAFPLLKRGIRINAICPGPTDTPLARANQETWLGFGSDYRADAGVEASTPLEQAYPLVFLCSDAASALSGETLISDVGYISSGITDSYPNAALAAKFLTGRIQ